MNNKATRPDRRCQGQVAAGAMRWLALALAAAACAAVAAWLAGGPSALADVKALYKNVVPESARRFLWVAREAYTNPLSWTVVLSVFALERAIPASRTQRVFSRGLVQDFIWFAADATFRMTLLPLYIGLLKGLYDAHLGALTIHALAAWPLGVRAAVSYLLFDFLNWLHHVIRHRGEVFWYFHMIHHSQREMNIFTDMRVHMVEYLVAQTIICLPMFILELTPFAIIGIAIFTSWYTRVYHANLRTNFGPLKHLLVTPQSHRIHHSLEPRHWNKNFGVILTVWDRMFGTLHAQYDEYPETGLEDERLPLEQGVDGLRAALRFPAQLWFPFGLLWGRLRLASGGRS